MFKEAFIYTNNYLNEKYEQYCMEILSEQINDKNIYYNMKFCTILDELIFVILYEPEQYFEVIDKVKILAHRKVLNLTKMEIDLLLIKCLGEFIEKHYHKNSIHTMSTDLKINYVVNELISHIKQEVAKRLVDGSEQILRIFLKELKQEISEFLYTGLLDGYDIYYDNFWHEFCRQVQYGMDYTLDLFLKDIQDHLYKTLNTMPTNEIILLFTQTDYFIFEENDLFPTPPRDEMIRCLVSKLMEDLKEMAEIVDLSHIYHEVDIKQ
jgi:hypothetical protein